MKITALDAWFQFEIPSEVFDYDEPFDLLPHRIINCLET
jgi:hypothetical protein